MILRTEGIMKKLNATAILLVVAAGVSTRP
jgi:hypothetical protein